VETHFFSTNKKIQKCFFFQKVMLILFWDISGPILEHYMEHGLTVNSERYSTMLKEKLKPAVRSKWRGLLSKTVLPHHDSARPCAAIQTIQNYSKTQLRASSSNILLSRLGTK
jgi:hypothetical protein